MPSDTRVSIDDEKCLACFSAAWWNGHAAQIATGAASATRNHCQPGNLVHGRIDRTQGQVGQRDEEHQRQDQPAAQPPYRGLVGRGPGIGLGLGRGSQLGGIAGRLDHADQVPRGRPGRAGDVRPSGRKIDRGGDTVDLVQLGLDPGRAGGAGHPADDQLDLGCLGGGGSDYARGGTLSHYGVPGAVTGASMVTLPACRKVRVRGTAVLVSNGAGSWRIRSSPNGLRVSVP